MDYKTCRILVRSKRTGKFEDDSKVEACLVVGSVVETSLKLAYRPQLRTLPIPLIIQGPSCFPAVTIKDVLPPEYKRAVPSLSVTAHPSDATLGLKVVTESMTLLLQSPYNLEVCTADHSGASACQTSHDVLMAPRLGAQSILPRGSYSVEYRCRQVEYKSRYWWDTLTTEALPLWLAELAQAGGASSPPSFLQARILVFACLAYPDCHAKPHSLHACITYGDTRKWDPLWGWKGFGQIPVAIGPPPVRIEDFGAPVGEEIRGPASSKPDRQEPARNTGGTTAGPSVKLSKEKQWARLVKKLGCVDDDWIQLPPFLEEVGENGRHAKRFVKREKDSNKCWHRLDGGYPRHLQDWRHMHSGKLGGGNKQSGGPIHVRKDFLKTVFLRKYAH